MLAVGINLLSRIGRFVLKQLNNLTFCFKIQCSQPNVIYSAYLKHKSIFYSNKKKAFLANLKQTITIWCNFTKT